MTTVFNCQYYPQIQSSNRSLSYQHQVIACKNPQRSIVRPKSCLNNLNADPTEKFIHIKRKTSIKRNRTPSIPCHELQIKEVLSCLIIIRIRRVRRPLRTIQPLNMPQPSPHLPLFHLRPRHLLLLLRLKLQLPSILCPTNIRTRRRAADCTRTTLGGADGARHAAARSAAVFEAVVGDG